MNRRLLHTAIALVFAGSLAACGSDSSAKSTTPPTTAAVAATTAAPTTVAATGAPTTAASSGGGYDYPVTTDAPTTVAVAPATTAAAAPAAGSASLALATDPKFGPIVVDADGFSLYMFTKDTGTTSACTGGCATKWPAAIATGTPTVGAGLDASLVGVAAQADGSMQLTYAGHLLYRFSGDSATGQVNGQDVGEVWYLVNASGAEVGDS